MGVYFLSNYFDLLSQPHVGCRGCPRASTFISKFIEISIRHVYGNMLRHVASVGRQPTPQADFSCQRAFGQPRAAPGAQSLSERAPRAATGPGEVEQTAISRHLKVRVTIRTHILQHYICLGLTRPSRFWLGLIEHYQPMNRTEINTVGCTAIGVQNRSNAPTPDGLTRAATREE